MDGPRFDAIARSFGTDTRRSVLQLIAGTSLGAALLGSLGLEDASAGCVAPGKKCKKKNGKKKKCCGGAKCKGKKCKCTNGGVGCGKTCCIPGQECQDATCVCLNGGVGCGETCCIPGQGCQDGSCVCLNGGATCGETCCIPGQLCLVVNDVPGCSNGLIPVGETCNPDQPGACQSGVCGCTGPNNFGCVCRKADCAAPGDECPGTLSCCAGHCLANEDPDVCGPAPD